MPWTTPAEPSLGLSILGSQLVRDGIDCRVYHASLELLDFLSAETYDMVAGCWAINELMFTRIIDPVMDEMQLGALEAQCEEYASTGAHSQYPTASSLLEMFLRVRNEVVPQYLVRCAEEILTWEPTLVGFTCMFDQTFASVALATLLKDVRPDLFVALGGYAVQYEPGLQVLRYFPQVDCIARGDGEPVITKLALASVQSDELPPMPGVLRRQDLDNGGIEVPAPKAVMDEVPCPSYGDWFRDVALLQERHSVTVRTKSLPLESSRGCWWGAIKHCVFCGIDEDTLKYRHKGSERVLEELAFLRNEYGDHTFRFSDYILPRAFYDDLLPRLAEVLPRYQLEAEIKANQPPDRMRRIAEAGFVELQPGIESFSTPVLKRMDKGVRGIQNVALLKNGYRRKITIQYNLLYGIPGDTIEDYAWLVERMPRLYHLTPPISRTETIVTRFAPLQVNPERFGLVNRATHHHSFDALFSQGILSRGFNLDEYCYYFESNFEFEPELRELFNALVIQTNHWKKAHRDESPVLSMHDHGDRISIYDSRFEEVTEYELTGLQADIYRVCDETFHTISSILGRLEHHRTGESRAAIQEAVEWLDDRRLVWTEGEDVLALAIPEDIVHSHIVANWPRSWTAIYC